jgi:hypothetical protein
MNMIIASARAYSVRAEYLSAGERFAVEEFTLEVVDGLDAYSIAFARADESAYADARVPDLDIVLAIAPLDPEDPEDPEPRPPSAMRPVCPKCGSGDICRDASASWNIALQIWELAGTYDCQTCGDCGAEGDDFVRWVPAAPQAPADQFFWAVVETLATPAIACDPTFQRFCLAQQPESFAEDAAAGWIAKQTTP